MKSFLPGLRALLSAVPRWGWLLAVGLLAGLLVIEGTEYGSAWLARRHLVHQQAAAKAEHQTSQQAGEAATVAFRLDSARRASQARASFLLDSTLRLQDATITKSRPARLPLPARAELPRERPN